MSSMSRYTYTAYGLHFETTFPMPELLPAAPAKPDIVVRYAEVPESLPSPSATATAWQAAPGQMLFFADVARYLILEDREIHVHPFSGSLEAEVRIFLLGPVLGALLHARRVLVLHASAIQTEHGAVLFVGRSGAGKSTLLGAFLQRGYAMLTDDKAGVTVDADGVPRALPGLPLTRLTADAMKTLKYPLRGEQRVLSLEKYVLPVAQFHPKTVRLRAVYSLSPNDRSEIRLQKLETAEQFRVLNSHIYQRRLINQVDQHQANFQTIGAVSRHARISRVWRPDCPSLADQPRLIDLLAACIEEDLRHELSQA
jgi:hypothetical protein